MILFIQLFIDNKKNRLPKNSKMGYYNNNLNLGVGLNTSFLKQKELRNKLDAYNSNLNCNSSNSNSYHIRKQQYK